MDPVADKIVVSTAWPGDVACSPLDTLAVDPTASAVEKVNEKIFTPGMYTINITDIVYSSSMEIRCAEFFFLLSELRNKSINRKM